MQAIKIAVLSTVLVLCCAGLAGSAYAYTATYVDTIDEQPIHDVYAILSAVQGDVGALDLDMEYNTYNDGSAVYYNLDRAVVDDSTTAMVAKNGNAARFCILVDTVTITAHGDDCKLSAFAASSTLAGDSAHGAAAFLHLSTSELTTATTATGYADLELDNELADGESLKVYAYLVVDVSQVAGTACTATGYTDYALPSKTLGTATIGEFAVSYKATSAQV